MNKRHQVIIIGGGPVGLALALDLGLRGVDCLLLERRATPARIPKGQNLTHRTLEHFYFWGIADELRAARLMPKGYPIGEITAYGDLMSEYWQASAGRELVRPFYFQDNERLPQYQMEAVLKQRLASLGNVETRFGWTATSIAQDEQGVGVAAIDGNGAEEHFTADYLAGCDGGQSLVRAQAGIARDGANPGQVMMLAVFRSRQLHERLGRFPQRSTYRVMHPDHNGYWQFFGRIDVGEGWFFHAPVAPGTTATPTEALALLHKAAGFEFACDFDHIGLWDLRVALAENYQAGRVFIAGDAAHSHPPYGGFGLNNGLEDAVNLGWKLAASLQKWGGATLLASYTQERQPIFEDIARDFIARRIENDAAFLARYNPARDRAAFERAWQARESDIGARVQVYEPNYEGSPVVAGPPGGVTSAHGEHSLAARAGHHLVPAVLSNGRNVYDELGRGFTLLAFDTGDGAIAAFDGAARGCRVPLKIVRDSFEGKRKSYDSRLILVRPDQYVAWTGAIAPADCVALLQKVCGQRTNQ